MHNAYITDDVTTHTRVLYISYLRTCRSTYSSVEAWTWDGRCRELMALYSFRKRPCIAAIILGTLVIFLLLYFFFEPENLDSEVSCSDKASVNFIKNLVRIL